MNKSALRKALFTVLSDKLKEHKLVVLDKIETTAKTKDLAVKLRTIAEKSGLGDKYILILAEHNKELERAAKNIPHTKILVANSLNVVDLMKYDLIITRDALNVIEKTYLPTVRQA